MKNPDSTPRFLAHTGTCGQTVHAPEPKALVLILCMAWAAHAPAQQGVQADPRTHVPVADLANTRERTRAAIEKVQVEQPGALDDVRTLGTQLTPSQQKARQEFWALRTQTPATSAALLSIPVAPTALGASSEEALRWQWPTLASPTAKRMLPRPEPAQQAKSSRPIFTPDFSRQRLTLASLVGQAMLDLPPQNVAEASTVKPVKPSVVDGAQALGLPDLVALGLSYSPVMDQVHAQLETAMARAKQARAELLPRASARYSKGPERSEGSAIGVIDHTTSGSALRLTQPLVNLPLIGDWLTQMSNERAAHWRMMAARESVAMGVTQATLNLAMARMVLSYSDEQLERFDRLLNHVQARAQTGLASTADLERTRTRVLLARQVRIEQQAQYKNALLELERLTGQVPEAMQLPYLNQLPGLPATQGEMRRVVWEHSHELRTLRTEIQAQRQGVASERSRLLPVVGLSLERDEGRNVRGINPRQTDSRLMAVVSWEMSLGGKEIYATQAAAAELSNREARLTEEGERIMQAMDADFASLQSATLRVTAGQAEQLAATAVVKSVEEQLRIGRLGSLLEALDAYERLFAASQRLVQTLVQQMQAQAQLLRRMGQLSAMHAQARVEMSSRNTTASPFDAVSPTPFAGGDAVTPRTTP